jgi:cell cycle arrest protein BUB3
MEYLLQAPPGDGISSLSFSPNQNELLLASSWDSTSRLYDVVNNRPLSTFNFPGGVLSSCFNKTGDCAFSAGLDCNVYSIDLMRGIKNKIGEHFKPVSSVNFCSYSNNLISASWDGSFSSRDIRTGGSENVSTVISGLSSKIFSLAISGARIIVGTSNHQIMIYDVRNLSAPEQVRESPLRHQIRKIACKREGENFAVGSTEVCNINGSLFDLYIMMLLCLDKRVE